MRRALTIENSEPTEKIIEKSRFIAYSSRAEGEEKARAFLAELKKEHPFATHICYAYIGDKQGNVQRFSDNGEPQGTAGMPILENLKSRDLVLSVLAVVRYFGGVKLGAGGLTRAYFSAAKEHLEQASFCEIVPCETWRFSAEYAAAESVKKLLEKRGIVPTVTYAEKAEFITSVPPRNCFSPFEWRRSAYRQPDRKDTDSKTAKLRRNTSSRKRIPANAQ